MTKTVHQGPPRTRILRRREVESRTGLGKSAIYLKVAQNQFPQPIKLGRRSVGWVEAEVQGWLEKQIEESRPDSARKVPAKNAAQPAAAAIRKQRIKSPALADECNQPDSALGHEPDGHPMELPNQVREGNS